MPKLRILDRWFLGVSRLAAPLRLLLVLLTLALLWLPFLLLGTVAIADPNLRSIVTLIILYLLFIGLVRHWGWIAHAEPEVLWRFGLRGRGRFWPEHGSGLWLGVALVLAMFSLEVILGWAVWRSPQAGFARIALEGLVMALAIGFAEELLFRGWIWDELRRDFGVRATLWSTAIVFALLHFLKPLSEVLRTWPQFFGLVLLGVVLNQAKLLFRGRLALPMGLHSGLVWGYYLVNVGQLVGMTGAVPDWVTGVDGNPLAGLVGIVFLLGVWRSLLTLRSKPNTTPHPGLGRSSIR